MRINYNVSSIIARNALNNNDMRLSKSTQRLSSGYKINSAKDDAAGLAISRKMNAQIKSLQQANRNSNDGLSVVNTADGAMAEMHDILQRMNELAIQSANGTNADSDREQIQLEIDQLVQEIDRIADTTQFNAQNLLDGSFAYKGYTNAENVKVMSYGDGVQSGIYAIDSLVYFHYEDKITTYTGELHDDPDNPANKIKDVKDVKEEESYKASDADDIQRALYRSASVSAYKIDNAADYEQSLIAGSGEMLAFSDGARVTLEDENIIIKGNNDFEVKLSLNSNTIKNMGKNVTDVTTCSVTTYVTTDCYRNITVSVAGDDSVRYNIDELNFRTQKNQNGNFVDDDNNILLDNTKIFTSSEEAGLRDLNDSFESLFKDKYPDCEVNVEKFVYNGNGTFTMQVRTVDKDNKVDVKRINLNLYQEKDNNGNIKDEKVLDDYQHSSTKTTKTKYTIGTAGDSEDILKLDLTGMGPMRLQVGANEGQVIAIEIPALNAINLGVDGLDISTEDTATAAIDIVGKAINQLSAVRAKVGAYANRIEHTITNLNTTEENMTAAYSRIMDVDMATEMTEYSTVQVLVQSSTSMLAQANERPQQVLQLLQ